VAATLSIEVPVTGTSLGATIVENEGTLAGTYEGDVICSGDVTMSDDVLVKGNLKVLGSFYNEEGWDLTVRGDAHFTNVYFDRTNTALPQGNFNVDGDMHYAYVEYRQSGGSAAQLRVGGDLIGNQGFSGSPIFANGLDDTQGANILIYGDFSGGPVQIFGGPAVEVGGGTGGNFIVYGDFSSSAFEAYGGDSGVAGLGAGNGGYIEVYGNATCYSNIILDGGESTSTGGGGSGGTLDVHGNLVAQSLDINGGFSDGGAGGSGGTLEVRGNAVITSDLDIFGGSSNTGFGGSGGSVYVDGNLRVGDDFRIRGGSGTAGGGGGFARIEGDFIVEDSFSAYGGEGASGAGGSGATIYVRGDFLSGVDDGSSIDIYGGFGGGGNGGTGGFLDVNGIIRADGDINMSGGDCDSTNEAFYAGAGGVLTCTCLYNPDYTTYVNAGSRSGLTSVLNTGNIRSNGGGISVEGDAVVWALNLDGGVVSTYAPNSPGGHGGILRVEGDLICGQDTSVTGGDAYGNAAGDAGELTVRGTIHAGGVYMNGGSSYAAGDSTPAGTNGKGPDDLVITSGVITTLAAIDGIGPGAANGGTNLLTLRGDCRIATLNVVDKATSYIKGSNTATLRVEDLTDKVTLNNGDNSQTADITTAAANKSSLYMYGADAWYSVAGVAV
jgi:hypothetical protein